MKTIKKIIMLLTAILTLINFVNGRAESSKVITLHIDLTQNILFSQYGVTVYLDGQEIGYLKQGDQLTYQVCVTGSDHVLHFYEERYDKAVIAVWQLHNLPDQCAISCRIKTCRNKIEIADVSIRTGDEEIIHAGFDPEEVNILVDEIRKIVHTVMDAVPN